MMEISEYMKSDQPIPQQIAYVGRLMFERHLTDMAGGNISVREGNTIYCTPRYAGSKWHWQLSPEEIVKGPIDSDELLQNPSFSREGLSHLWVYRTYPEVKAIIHAHPLFILPFCAAEKVIEPTLLSTEKIGPISFIPHVPQYSQAQAESIVASLGGKEDLMRSFAAAVLLPRHGIFVAGKDLWSVLDALERISINAWCLIARRILE